MARDSVVSVSPPPTTCPRCNPGLGALRITAIPKDVFVPQFPAVPTLCWVPCPRENADPSAAPKILRTGEYTAVTAQQETAGAGGGRRSGEAAPKEGPRECDAGPAKRLGRVLQVRDSSGRALQRGAHVLRELFVATCGRRAAGRGLTTHSPCDLGQPTPPLWASVSSSVKQE